MLGLLTIRIPNFPSKSKPLKKIPPVPYFLNPNFPLKSQPRKQFRISAQNGNGIENGGEVKNEGRPRLNLKWMDLVLDPDPDNLVAVGLTGLLTWASVQVLWQLFVISGAILLAALKYTIVAVLLIFILITLL